MKGINRLLLILLIASICFNLFFTAGYLRSRAVLNKLKTVEGRMQILARQLDLTPSQEEQFVQLRLKLKDEAAKMKEAHAVELNAFWAEMLTDKADGKKVNDMIASSASRREGEVKVVVDYIRETLAILTPEQRQAFVKMIREKNYFGDN